MKLKRGLPPAKQGGSWRHNALRCPECGGTKSVVIESREHHDGTYVRRQRGCKCGARFTAYERYSQESIRTPKSIFKTAFSQACVHVVDKLYAHSEPFDPLVDDSEFAQSYNELLRRIQASRVT